MSNKGLVVVWPLLFITIFCAGYLLTYIIVTRVMADFKVEEQSYTTLEVKPNYGTQNDNHYKVQPAKNVQEQE